MPPIGREPELSLLRATIEEPPQGSCLIEIVGPPGIGKSTIWLAAVDHARSIGRRTLVARPAEAERMLAYSALFDLLEDHLEPVLDRLAPPRRQALEVALLRSGPVGAAIDARVLGAAVRDALEILAAEPLLLGIDDVQWLDGPSADALGFALRRAGAANLVVVTTRRADAETQALPVQGEQREIEVGPLSLGAIQTMLRERSIRSLPRPTLLKVFEASGGNPFYALELARAMRGSIDATGRLPVPATLEDAVRHRLDDLDPAMLRALSLVAVLGRMTYSRASEAEIATLLEDAHADGLLERNGDLFAFAQPLLASVLLQRLRAEDRREAHALAARLSDDPVEQARHLAMATTGPSAEVAASLDRAAAVASARGAAAAAADLREQALILTPPDSAEDRRRRTLDAIAAHDAAGDRPRARTMARALVDSSPSGPPRAVALLALQKLDRLDTSMDLLIEALGETGGDPRLEAVVNRELADVSRLTKGQDYALERAEAAVKAAEASGDSGLVARCMSVLGMLRFRSGERDGPDLVRRAYELAQSSSPPAVVREVADALVLVLVWSGDSAGAREVLESQLERWRDHDEPWTADALWFLSLAEFRAGRWEVAALHADDVLALTEQHGIETPVARLPAGIIAAHRGDLPRAREIAEQSIALAAEQGAALPALIALVGLVDLWEGDPHVAADRFAEADTMAREYGWGEPAMLWWLADEAEALLELGRIDEAEAMLDEWEHHARRLDRRHIVAYTQRLRGLVLVARGDTAAGIGVLENAVGLHEEAGDEFGKARTLLALGSARRRDRQKAAARNDLEQAADSFRMLGAPHFVERATAEISRISGRAARQELTETERRVARLVAAGKTNREVAAALFLGERTVASHLTRIYAKTGVRSRTELAAKVQTF